MTDLPDTDFTQRFIFDDSDTRGEMVSLELSYAEVLAKHAYPEPVAQLLGELMAAAALLVGSNWLGFLWAVDQQLVIAGSLGYFLVPLVNVVLGMLVLKERLNPKEWLAVGLALAAVGEVAVAAPQNALLWLPGLIGFALLAGVIPLHGWAPQAHAGASAPAAALFSTVVMKVGLYGMLTVSLAGGVPPLWWGVMLLVLGMITAFIGGLYALMEHNIQRLLAYHTLENIGIILLGLGAFVTGVATSNTTLMVLGFIGGMYHLINHSLFKTTLFLGAGAVWFRTGHRDIEKLGGIGKKMPLISLSMLVGADGDGRAAAAERLCRGVGDLSVLLRARPERRIYRTPARPAAGGRAGDYRGAGGDVYGESLRRDLPRRAAHPRSGKRLLRTVVDGRERGCAGAVLHRGRRRRAVAAAAAGQRHSAAADRGEYHRLSAHDRAAADCRAAAAIHSEWTWRNGWLLCGAGIQQCGREHHQRRRRRSSGGAGRVPHRLQRLLGPKTCVMRLA